MPCSSMAVQSWGMTRGVTRGHPEAQPRPVPPEKQEGKGRGSPQPCPALPYLQAAVHHADDKVELLVVQHGAVLLHVQVQLLRQAVPGCPALHGTQHGREQLWERGLWGWDGACTALSPHSSVWAHTGMCSDTETKIPAVASWTGPWRRERSPGEIGRWSKS